MHFIWLCIMLTFSKSFSHFSSNNGRTLCDDVFVFTRCFSFFFFIIESWFLFLPIKYWVINFAFYLVVLMFTFCENVFTYYFCLNNGRSLWGCVYLPSWLFFMFIFWICIEHCLHDFICYRLRYCTEFTKPAKAN